MAVKMAPTSVIEKHLGINADGRVQKFFTQTCAIHMDKYVPMYKGNLRDYTIEGNQIIYDQPYAEYQYYGISKTGKKLVYSPLKHPLATSYWDRTMVTNEMSDIVKEVQDFVNRGA
jgi:hypothetical protein